MYKAQLADYRRQVVDLYAAVRKSTDPADAWADWRKGRDELFASHDQSPVPADDRLSFGGSPFFEYDPAWRVLAEIDTIEEDVTLIDNSGGGTTGFIRFCVARSAIHGEPFALNLYWLDSYGGGVFLPFRDLTNLSTTYGEGRYLLDGAKGADLGKEGDALVLDFNFSYHPSCVWDDRWSCPLAPPGNSLPIEIRAGERLIPRDPTRRGA
ncbi:MAG: DUF1684 domain-containing protein [Acidimicrobiia bacterium]|nr:MAG: DUF1684 domain-containing protein [Acidimicrobiia bacterium]